MVRAFTECERIAKIRANLRSGFTFGDPELWLGKLTA
jgi:hypothetical protein